MASSNFGGTVVSGIQDISALLPLLGTEQCEQHVGSALEKGFLYPAVTPISIFGSLGIVRSAFNILVASLSIRDLRFLGATKLKDGGFDPKGDVAPMIAVDPRHPQRFLAESRLEEMLAEEHIENVENLEVSWDAEIFWWNAKLVLSTAMFAGLGLLPYVAIIRRSRHPSGIPALPSGWGFPIIRVMGSAVCVNVAQFIIQKRIMVILKTRLLFITLDRLAKKGKEDEEDEFRPPGGSSIAHDQMDWKHRSSSTVASTQAERDIHKCLAKFVYAEGNRQRWSSDWTSETCIWELRGWLADNVEPAQVEAGTELANLHDIKLRTSAFVEQEFSRHFGRMDKAIWVWIPWIHQFLPFLLVLGAIMIIIGYVGCFNLVSHPDSVTTSSLSLYLWVALEGVLSLVRIAIWAINPSWDDSKGVTFTLKLAKRPPLMTCKETGIDIIKGGAAPLTRADSFLEEIVAYKGPFPLFDWNNVELYYILTVDDTSPSILAGPEDVRGLLFIAIHNYKEDTSRLIYRDKFGQFQIYICFLEFDNKKSTVNVKVDFVNDKTQHASHSFTANGRSMEDLIFHYNEIISLLSDASSEGTRSFSKTWAMQRFSQKRKQRRYKQIYLLFQRALGTFMPKYRTPPMRPHVARNVEVELHSVKWEPYFIREEDKAYLRQVQLERLWEDFYPQLEEWVELYILRYMEELFGDLHSLRAHLSSKLPPNAYARNSMGDMQNNESAEAEQLLLFCRVIMEAFLKASSQSLFKYLGASHDNMIATIVNCASPPSGRGDTEIQEGGDTQRTEKLKARLYAERMALFQKQKDIEDKNRVERWARHVQRGTNGNSSLSLARKKEYEEDFRGIFRDDQALFGSWDSDKFETFSRVMRKHGLQGTSQWSPITPYERLFEDNSREIMINRSQDRFRRLWSRMQTQREEFFFVSNNIQSILNHSHHKRVDQPSTLHNQWAYWSQPSLEERGRLSDHINKYLVLSNSSIEKVGGLKNISQALKRNPHISFVQFEDKEEQLTVDDISTFLQDIPWITGIFRRSSTCKTESERQRIEEAVRCNTLNAISEGRDVCSYSGFQVGYDTENYIPKELSWHNLQVGYNAENFTLKDRTWLTPDNLREASTVTVTFFTSELGRDHTITLRQVCVEPDKVKFALNGQPLRPKEPLVRSDQFIDQDILLPTSLLNFDSHDHNELKIIISSSERARAQHYNHYFLAYVSLPVRVAPTFRSADVDDISLISAI